MPGKPAHVPTKATRELVSLHATMGTPHEAIAAILEIDRNTMYKYYRKELDLSKHKANASVGGTLYKKAMSGDTAAMVFWMKTQARWRTTEQVDHVSSDGSMTPTKIERIIVDPKNPDT